MSRLEVSQFPFSRNTNMFDDFFLNPKLTRMKILLQTFHKWWVKFVRWDLNFIALNTLCLWKKKTRDWLLVCKHILFPLYHTYSNHAFHFIRHGYHHICTSNYSLIQTNFSPFLLLSMNIQMIFLASLLFKLTDDLINLTTCLCSTQFSYRIRQFGSKWVKWIQK
jgi:hypothetical protein